MELKIDYFSGLIQVTYQTDLFLDKNKDYVIAEHQALLNASQCGFISGLFLSSEDSSKSSKFSSIGARFKVRHMLPLFQCIIVYKLSVVQQCGFCLGNFFSTVLSSD
jgi:hypothetical protein